MGGLACKRRRGRRYFISRFVPHPLIFSLDDLHYLPTAKPDRCRHIQDSIAKTNNFTIDFVTEIHVYENTHGKTDICDEHSVPIPPRHSCVFAD